MKKLKYILFILPFLFSLNVFADDFNVSSSITSPSGSPSAGGYEGLEIYNSGSTNRYAINTRYNGRLSRIRFNVPLPNNWPDGECFSSGDLNYTLTLNMATNDWRNNFGTIFISNNSGGTNWFTSFTYVSRQQIKINFKIPTTESCYDFLFVDIQSKNLSSTAFTGETNWDLKSVVLTANFPSSGSGSGSGSGSSGATNQDIINNNNQNTQDIINNNNQNTQDIINNNNDNTQQIIENQNQNTQQQIDSQKVCKDISYLYNSSNFNTLPTVGYLESNGTITGGSIYRTTDYIPINSNNNYNVNFSTSSGGWYYCLYNSSKSLVSCSQMSSTFTININYNGFARFSTRSSYTLSINGNVCQNGNQAIGDTITDSNVDSGVGSDFFDDFTSSDFGLSQIITIPLNTIQSLTSKSCVPLQVPIPFTNSNITLPCMTEIYETKFPSIYNLWKIVSFGIVAYLIAIDIFHIVKGFKDPESDKVEVLDL